MIGGTCLVDTGPLVALFDRDCKQHKLALKIFADLSPPMLTCEPVLTEAAYLLSKISSRAVDDLLSLGEDGIYKVSWTLDDDYADLRSKLQKYKNVPISLADAALISVAEKFDNARIVTFDSDFYVYRWGRNQAFEVIGC